MEKQLCRKKSREIVEERYYRIISPGCFFSRIKAYSNSRRAFTWNS